MAFNKRQLVDLRVPNTTNTYIEIMSLSIISAARRVDQKQRSKKKIKAEEVNRSTILVRWLEKPAVKCLAASAG
jgi:hypothetical protein